MFCYNLSLNSYIQFQQYFLAILLISFCHSFLIDKFYGLLLKYSNIFVNKLLYKPSGVMLQMEFIDMSIYSSIESSIFLIISEDFSQFCFQIFSKSFSASFFKINYNYIIKALTLICLSNIKSISSITSYLMFLYLSILIVSLKRSN